MNILKSLKTFILYTLYIQSYWEIPTLKVNSEVLENPVCRSLLGVPLGDVSTYISMLSACFKKNIIPFYNI